MRKLMRCKKCGYNFLVVVSDEPESEAGKAPAVLKCPSCGAPQN